MHRRQFLASLGVAALSSTLPLNGNGVYAGSRKCCTLLHVTDTHAQLETHPEFIPGQSDFPQMGGFARLKRAIDVQRASAVGPAFLVDGGDLVQGSAPAAWSQGEVMIRPANALGLDAFVPGNWEPVYGPERFEALMGSLTTKVIAYNFHRKASGVRLFDPAVTIMRDGVKVCFVGIADPTTTLRQPPTEVIGLDSTRLEGFREFLQEVRRREKPDLLVAVTHTGLTLSRELAVENPELDVILSGHTHERTQRAIRIGNCLVVEAGSHGSFLGRLDLVLKKDGGIENYAFRLLPVLSSQFDEDPTVKAEVESELQHYRERMGTVLCETSVPILRYDVLETNADNLITDAVREATGAEIGVSNGFRFGPPIPPGPFTETDLWNLLPVDARMKMGWITGAELKQYLEDELELVFSSNPWKLSGGWGPRASGLSVIFQAHEPKGRRLREVRVNGKPAADNARYSFAGCERDGEPMDVVCRHRGTYDVVRAGDSIHAAMRIFLRNRGVISPENTGRSRAVDLPVHVFSQDQILTSKA